MDIIITTIAKQKLPAFDEWSKLGHLILVGDTKTGDLTDDRWEFISYAEQLRRWPKLAKAWPTCHYGRKNFGYLAAESKWIFETDDDNHPMPGLLSEIDKCMSGTEWECDYVCSKRGWVNVYGLFTSQMCWPRGLPAVHAFDMHTSSRVNMNTDVHVWLPQGHPDLAAHCRITCDEDVQFIRRLPVVTSQCPWNTQATLWPRSRIIELQIPLACNMRVADILRSYYFKEDVMYHSPLVRQVRNTHDLIQDLKDERPLDLQLGMCGGKQEAELKALFNREVSIGM